MKNIARSSKFKFLNNLDLDLQNHILNYLRIIWAFSSNAIEGNTLSLADTKFIVEKEQFVGGKTIKENNEVIGHIRAINTFYEMLDKDIFALRDLFALYNSIHIDSNIIPDNSMEYWNCQVNNTHITIEEKENTLQFPTPDAIPSLMEKWFVMFGKFREMRTWEELIEHCAAMHLSYSAIHPFYNENGRIIRLISNYPLLMSGYPPIIYSMKNRKRYLDIISSYLMTTPKLNFHSNEIINKENQYYTQFVEFCKEEYLQIQEIIETIRCVQSIRTDLAMEEVNKKIIKWSCEELN